ncbi:hypothetical protein PAE9249_01465 [Paenibacillus sp. CECT 9249]|uniref:phosphotransferase n=1 Tax=Paenibacillus sp. CECT 9249 TaxID=2845385 RepID=UPI001E3EF7C7|nr:phosphotransferase [Paenibacillus sp. CECT 9249]CAH0118968.1 hypothetical protein PAE9249_01465 [Paenibacillus sp. CECT 9249]
MIPERLSAYDAIIPLLDEVIEWSLLRKWSLSEVYRVTLKSGQTRIMKWGGKEMAGEATMYQQLVSSLKVPSPHIYGFFQLENSAVIIMEDCGRYNLEQQPNPAHFLEAARVLARLRETASANLGKNLRSEVIRSYSASAADFLALLDDLLRSRHLARNETLLSLQTTFPHELQKLYQTIPFTLVHHDYHAKNLVIQKNGILPIDWSLAYLSPHLGDLYCLIAEARSFSNVSKKDILSAFRDEVHSDLSIEQLNWQVSVGGICWLVKTLKWLVYGGTDTIPGSEAWIPDLMNDLENLMKEVN